MFTQEQLLDYLSTNNISYNFYTHVPLFTCKEAAQVVEELQIPGTGIKNLFLKDKKKNLYLIVATDMTAIDLKMTGKTLKAKELRFADATLLMHHLGVEPGSVTPLAVLNDKEHKVQIIIDSALCNQDVIQVHRLKNSATVVITPADLFRFFHSLNRSYLVYDFEDNKIDTV